MNSIDINGCSKLPIICPTFLYQSLPQSVYAQNPRKHQGQGDHEPSTCRWPCLPRKVSCPNHPKVPRCCCCYCCTSSPCPNPSLHRHCHPAMGRGRQGDHGRCRLRQFGAKYSSRSPYERQWNPGPERSGTEKKMLLQMLALSHPGAAQLGPKTRDV